MTASSADDLPLFSGMMRAELAARLKKNAHYSLRAFARDLGMSPGYLSQVLSAKKRPKLEKAAALAAKLGWDQAQIREFLSAVQDRGAAEKERPSRYFSDDFAHIDVKQFETISRWFHYAIAELTTLHDFRPSLYWIADRLGLSLEDTRSAVAALFRVGLLEKHGSSWRKSHQNYDAGDAPAQAVKNYHKEVLEKAKVALDQQDFHDREFIGAALGIRKERLPEAKKLIEDFYLKFMELMEEGPADAVYQLNIGFFRLDSARKRRTPTKLGSEADSRS